MDEDFQATSLFSGLAQTQSLDQAKAECIRLIKEHYRSNPGPVLRECLHQGWLLGRMDLLEAAMSLAQRAQHIPGQQHLPRDLREEWMSWIDTAGGDRGMFQAYIDLCLDGKVEGLWTTGMGGYKSIVSMWRTISPYGTFPQAIEFIHAHPSGPRPPDAVLFDTLEHMGVHRMDRVAQMVSAFPLRQYEPALRTWMTRHEGLNVHDLVETLHPLLVVAPHFPDHPLWQDAQFQVACVGGLYVPAMVCLAEVAASDQLDALTELVAHSPNAGAWHDALDRRRAREAAQHLERETVPVLADRRTARL